MALKTTKSRKRRKRKPAVPKPPRTTPKVRTARRPQPSTALKRTSMWLGEDLLKATAEEASRLGISRALWVQITLRTALGMPAIQIEPTPTPDAELSVFG